MATAPDEGAVSPIERLERQDRLALIREALRPIEWKVLRLQYLEGLTGTEVARRLRLSAARVCQIHTNVVDRLKSRLGSLVEDRSV